MEGLNFPLLGLLLFVSTLVAMITRRLRLPYATGLVAAGLILAILPLGVELPLTPEIIFSLFLPPLIFDAAIRLPWRQLQRELGLLIAMVTLGLVGAAALVAAGMHYLVGWSWLGAAFFGVLIAATDPVSVIALFKDIDVDERLKLLIEAESLLNDAVAAVLFAVLLTIAAGQEPTTVLFMGQFALTAGGGFLVGAAVAGPLLLLAGRTEDHLVEITLTTLAAWGSFLLAEHLHVSGVLAALTAGLLVGNVGWMGSITDTSRRTILDFWEYMAFLANSLIFLLIGATQARMPLLEVLGSAIAAVAIGLIGRAVAVYPVAQLFRGGPLDLPPAYQHVLWWGGLRGALALALALALPATVPERGVIIVATFAVVAFSLFVLGLSMAPLVRRLGLVAQAGQDGASTVSTASGDKSG